MILRNRHSNRSWALGLAAAFLMASVATPALAEHPGKSDRGQSYRGQSHRGANSYVSSRYGRHDSRYRGGHSSRHHGSRHHAPTYRTVVHGDYCARDSGHRGHRYSRSDSSYYCQPCGHRFHDRSAFHRHLSGHHHIPLWRLPFVIVHSTLGWIFHG